MFKFLTNLFDDNKKTLDRYAKLVDSINAFEPKLTKLSDEKLAAQTAKFKEIVASKTSQGSSDKDILEELLPEAFATVREVSKRLLGLRQYDVQLIAGIALHHGMVTEQRTGEGKTLTVAAPLYLNALLGKGAHLVTVNDYLAELGVGWIGPIYHFLGMSTSVVVHDASKLYNPEVKSEERGDERLEHFETISRQAAYAADITYGTNNEFGFDYLRDNMVQTIDQMVQRPLSAHQFAIVDEADSILIDEARTPLIISSPDTEPTKQYYEYAKLVTTLEKNADYDLDEKGRTVTLSDLGVKRMEKRLGVSNLYEESFDTIHHIETALKAKTLFTRDKDYIVREGEVIIVDEHTGRLMYGRRYSDGLHQAIEAKEGVTIQQESRTLATISLQNYFRMYTKLSGMTGTAATEAEEFRTIYNMEVLIVPTNKPVVRKDTPDVVYKTQTAKYSAIVQHIEELHKTGQPVLLGTRSIEHNQIISNFLTRKKIPHQVLNAKNHEKEAFIIADAGKKGAITVATNIAGRGVDIVLGGAKPERADFKTQAQFDKARDEWSAAHQAVVQAGGLHIVGTERHESRRIDNQLRGRAGRQGDPGASQFYVSLEDEIMRIFGGEQIAKAMDFLKIDENQPIEHGMVSKAIESAQVKVEGFFFDQRKRLVEFDDVMNTQREIIYKRRRRLLEQGSQLEQSDAPTLKEQVLGYIDDEVAAAVAQYASSTPTDDDVHHIVAEFTKLIPFDDDSQKQLEKTVETESTPEAITEKLIEIAHQLYESKETHVGTDQMRMMERLVILSTIDEKWMDHLDAVEALRDGIWLRGDKKTVLSEYKKEAFGLFESLVGTIESTIASRIFRVQLTQVSNQSNQMAQAVKHAVTQKDELSGSIAQEMTELDPSLAADADPGTSQRRSAPQNASGSVSDLAAALGGASASTAPKPGVAKTKIGRNDPCPCGSGLKYKKCGLIGAKEHRG